MEEPGAPASDRRHASHRVADQLEAAIDAGEYPPDRPLPSYRRIANDYGIAINTAQAAVRLLSARGRVHIRANSGAYVCNEPHASAPGEELREIQTDVARLRKQLNDVSTGLAEVERRVDEAMNHLTSEDK
ncbi:MULTISPECIES: winged helix-turn-helix domain-containing protein [Protofrankia]|uniref:winged helix-turn-helix domain-containing protein n=1 Tax=Protofrankia TaxID=2994361 RepID=UPI0006998819|nr:MULTISPECIES: winged helix-turn-helix domain-containing protein [Protofrankia]ONH34945.1 hypothetical protein BL254_13365 [Protofrankia sp. BMG5.30]